MSDLDAAEVSGDAMRAGIDLAQHYADEGLRLFGASQQSKLIRGAIKLNHWLRHSWQGETISLPDIYQYGPNFLRDASIARPIAAVLEEHGWLVPLSQGTTGNGNSRRENWRIIRN
jgi:hypothetical protein